MIKPAYYNEINEEAAQWLRNLISAGHIAPGDVDERSIEDVRPIDLRGYTQCHFFAGIGVWSYALRRAGWRDDRPVWTGSCPCQPFSAAGKGDGFADERHLWPAWFHLIEQCDIDVVLGEQVASKDGLAWLDLVHSDMEAAGRAFGAFDLCSAGVGAPHIRQRLYFVGDTFGEGLERHARYVDSTRRWKEAARSIAAAGSTRSLADNARHGRGEERQNVGRLLTGDATQGFSAGLSSSSSDLRPHAVNGFWRASDWLFCRDERWRAVEPGTFPLAHGAPSRVGRVRAYGNAVNAELTETFIREYMQHDRERVI